MQYSVHRRHALHHAAGRALGVTVAILLTACSSSRHSRDSEATTPNDPIVDALAASYAQDMQDLGAARPPASGNGTPIPGSTGIFIEPIQPEPAPTNLAATDAAPPGPTADAVTPTTPAAASQPDVQALARQLAAALRRRAVEGVSPYEDLSRVAMLEGIAPGVLEGLGDTADADSADLVAILAPSERDALRAARRTARALAESESADPALAADALRAAAESLDQSQDIRIPNVALCTRVDGFARYQTFDSTTFLAGRPNPMIVYAEVDRFRQRPVGGTQLTSATDAAHAGPSGAPASGSGASIARDPAATPGSRFVVTLTQSLNLYFADGGLLVWRRAPQTITDYSAARFRDFYIIDQIELPPTLAAGAYSLKVIVRDEATGQQTESIIPITLVAEAGLARGG